MEFSIPDCFMLSFVCGLFFGLVYETFRIIRQICRLTIITILSDICFFLLSTFFIAELSMLLGDHIRIYTIFGFLSGTAAYVFTIGRLFNSIETALVLFFRKAFYSVYSKLKCFFKKRLGAIAHIVGSLFGKVADFSSNIQKKSLKHLHFTNKKMYNNNSILDIEKESNSRGSEQNRVIKANVRRSS